MYQHFIGFHCSVTLRCKDISHFICSFIFWWTFGLCLCCCCFLVTELCLTLCDPMDCSQPDSSVHGVFQARKRVGCHFFLQGIFLTQGSNPCLPHCRQTLYQLSHQESPTANCLSAYFFFTQMLLYTNTQSSICCFESCMISIVSIISITTLNICTVFCLINAPEFIC
jgi:hypothetical protein